MGSQFALLIVSLCMLTLASAGEPARSYVFSGRAAEVECDLLPTHSFEIRPSLERTGTSDRLTIECLPGKEHISLTFLLRDAIALPRTKPGSYSFRWGAKVPSDKGAPTEPIGEFTADAAKCGQILKLLKGHATHSVSTKVSWNAACYPEARWGTVMEITLTENAR
jgi:hypothetical protein